MNVKHDTKHFHLEGGSFIHILKWRFGVVLLICMLFFSACSSKEEADEENESENETTSNQDEEEENDDTDDEEQEEAEEEVPDSNFTRSNLKVDSNVFRSNMDINSDIKKDIIDTLSEYDAVEVDDGTMLTLPEEILFDFDSSKLQSDADEVIKELTQIMEEVDGDMTIVGHTDNKGKDSYNQDLSEDRAKAVLEALVDKGVKEKRLKAEGKGADDPVAKNEKSDGSDDEDGRQKNRRVEVTIEDFEEDFNEDE